VFEVLIGAPVVFVVEGVVDGKVCGTEPVEVAVRDFHDHGVDVGDHHLRVVHGVDDVSLRGGDLVHRECFPVIDFPKHGEVVGVFTLADVVAGVVDVVHGIVRAVLHVDFHCVELV